MRTNPFYDSWLFLIGSTDDHHKLGALGYVFVVLFLALLVATLWIAATNWRQDPSQRTGTHVATWICRVLIGCMWFQGCLWKLPLPYSEAFADWTRQIGEHAAFAFHREFAKDILVPYLAVLTPITFLAELSFAITMILGVAVRLFASLAVLFALNLWLGLYTLPSEWPWNYFFIVIIHVLFVAHAAGRSLGLDALLRRNSRAGLIGRLVAIVG
jgi:uncharacterized membrane protein YphA (DoxX/SURF4 family)